MTMSKPTLHPFFQPRKPQKAQSPPTPSPDDAKRERRKPVPSEKAHPDAPSPTVRVPVKKAAIPAVSLSPPPFTLRKTRLQHQREQEQLKEQQNKVTKPVYDYVRRGECSTPHYVPITKPKFYSDTVEEEASLDLHSKRLLQKKKNRSDHEFSRMNRRIYGNGHITDKKMDTSTFDSSKYLPRTEIDMQQYIRDYQHDFFLKHRQSRESSNYKNDNHRDVKMALPVSTQSQVEALLNMYFPNWHIFSSCVVLFQSIFDTTQRKDDSNKQWIDKYRPRHLNGLLGERHNHRYLKDWLHQMKIEPLSAPTSTNEKPKKCRKKKHKKLVMHHDVDFDDEEAFLKTLSLYEDDQDDDFMIKPGSKKELKKGSMKSNIILLVGDHGIGKTASVYTIAEQMDYAVFEINPGSKRSGKDIMSAVGEMTKSHLVAFGIASPVSPSFFDKPITSIKPTRSSKKKKLNPTLRSSSSTAAGAKPTLKDFLVKNKPSTPPLITSTVTAPTTKQSLILLEEVDILFEEDKGFWASVIEMSQTSKRPIIMTCNDPEQVPIESMSLQVIIDMKPPTETELLAYLWLMCFAEGYTVDPADLVCLVAFLGRDIRQLIQTLELYAGQGMFGEYLGINESMNTVETKSKCVSSRIAIDTFRLARSYQQLDGYVQKEEPNELEDIERILENNAFIDTCLRWKENGTMIQETVQDQLNGYTTLWVEDDEDSSSKHVNKEIECITTVLNNSSIDWIMDEESHWDELCDASMATSSDYKDAIENLLPLRQVYQPNDPIVMMEYVPYIQQMIVPVETPTKSRTRSKRKRMHLPLNDDAVDMLTNQKALIDETQVHIQLLFDLKKDQ